MPGPEVISSFRYSKEESQTSIHLFLRKSPADGGFLIGAARGLVERNILHSNTSPVNIIIRDYNGFTLMKMPPGRLRFLRKAFLVDEDYRQKFFKRLESHLIRAEEVVITRVPKHWRDINEAVDRELKHGPLPKPTSVATTPPPPKPRLQREIEEILDSSLAK